MENISRIVDKELLKGLALKSRKRSQNWDMFFVADDGNMFVIKKFKWFLRICILLFAVMFLSLTIAVIFLVRSEITKNQYLKELTEARVKIENLTLAKENLEAERVIILSNNNENTEQKEAVNGNEKESQKQEKIEVVKEKFLSAGKVFLSKRSDSNNYKTRFRLTNLTNNDKPINGYVFLILKKNDGTVDRIVPNVNLINEKPTEYRNGQYFSISRFKTVRFNFTRPTPPDAYKECVILAYSTDGKLLLEDKSSVKVDLIVPQNDTDDDTEKNKDEVKAKDDIKNNQEDKKDVDETE